MIRRLTALASASLLLLTLGCGNKGPLYLPQDSAADDQQQEDARR
ncbi:MAG: lipoprotein [Gammaproteobacteria bacterium]|nr:lipoprotein [Gammaproteobacteria bacterium]